MTDGLVEMTCLACGAKQRGFDWAGDNWDCAACDVRQLAYRRDPLRAVLRVLFPHGGDLEIKATPQLVEELARSADAGLLQPFTRADVERLLSKAKP